jgi:hypothetical protein
MASTFRLKRKTYSDNQNQNNQGSGWGKKLAIGAGIAAAGFMGAKGGMLGAGAQKWAGKTWARAGKAIGNENMMLSGAKSYGQGSAQQMANRRADLIASGSKNVRGAAYTDQQIANKADKIGNNFLGTLLKK